MNRFSAIAIAVGMLVNGLARQDLWADEFQPKRRLAPWVMTVIQPDARPRDTYSPPRELLEITRTIQDLSWQPNFTPVSQTLSELAKRVIIRRQVWNLEFAFKPVRMMHVDLLPTSTGDVETKLVWYLVYRIRNPGFHLRPKAEKDDFNHDLYTTEQVNHDVRFFPKFVLRSLDQGKAYQESILPKAVEQISAVETPNSKLLNSVEVSDVSIRVSTPEEDHSLWGVATWVGVDPRTDFFSVQIHGLSNAYRLQGPADAESTVTRKTLQLNFWRAGDAVRPDQREIRYGLPSIEDVRGGGLQAESDLLNLYKIPIARDYRWVYSP